MIDRETTGPAPAIQSVVHATDFSAADERAFSHALAVALLNRARLVLVHVATDAHGDWSRFPAVRKTLERWGLLEPNAPQSAVFETVGVSVAKMAISSPFPALAVANYLNKESADLLVVATEGREGAARWLHGSVAEAMSRWSRTMTLFVPADAQRSIVAPEDGSLTLENILIPVDHAPNAGTAIDFACRMAESVGDGGVTITLLHVGDDADPPSMHLKDGSNWTFQTARRSGEPVDQIIAAAELIRADLIVMPTAGRAGVFEALRGSTTERVLRRAPCPLLAIPAARQ